MAESLNLPFSFFEMWENEKGIWAIRCHTGYWKLLTDEYQLKEK